MNKTLSILIAFLLLFGALPGAVKAEKVVYSERSLYRNIYVTDGSDMRCLRFNMQNNTRQSCFSFRNPDNVLFECNRMILGSLYLRPNPRRVLMIGLGGGTLTSAFSKLLPASEIDVVEIDPAMVRVAKEYFNFKPTAKIHVYTEDGRVYVKRAITRREKYDLIVLDAFDDIYIPSHMLTQQFLLEVQRLLTDDGVVAANTYCNSKRYDQESATYQAVFGTFFNLKKFWKNTRVIIAKQGVLPSHETLSRNAKALEPKFAKFGIESSWLLPMFTTEQDWDEDARIITDNFLPW